jgi:hypothetical protein
MKTSEGSVAGPYREPAECAGDDDEAVARRALRSDLAPGETLFWAGRPLRGVLLSLHDVFLIPFSLVWGGFALFWECFAGWAFVEGAPTAFRAGTYAFFVMFPFMLLFAGPLVVFGQFLLWGRFVYDARRRERTFYGLSESRAIVLVERRRRSLTSISLEEHAWVEVVEERRGRGSIRFARSNATSTADERDVWSWPMRRRKALPRFELIDQAGAVKERVRKAQRALRRSHGHTTPPSCDQAERSPSPAGPSGSR